MILSFLFYTFTADNLCCKKSIATSAMNLIEEQELRKENERLKEELRLLKQNTNEKEAYQMMKAIFHELPSAILIKDIEDDYRFYIINRKFEQMCNMPKELLVGKTDYEVFPKDEADKYRRDDMEAATYTEDAPMLIHEIVTSRPWREYPPANRQVLFFL